jgi:succinoglycan biosynthesis transport protein ExoP
MTNDSNGYEAMNTRQTTGVHLRELINLLRRRWKLIVVAIVVAGGLVGIIALVFPPRYTATAEVIVDPPRGRNGGAELSVAGVLDDAAVQTHVAALRSESHLQHVFDRLVEERGPGPKEIAGLLGPEEFSIDKFTKRINAFKDTHSRMIGITYISTDPAFAAAVADRSVELYLATLAQRIIAARNDALRSLSKSIPRVKAEVEHADAALQTYRSKHGFAEASRVDTVDQQLIDLHRQLAIARSDLAGLQARPTTLRIGNATNQSQLAEESSTLETRVRQLEQRISVLQEASNEMREPEAQLREMQRHATTLAQLYDGLVQRERAILEAGEIQPDIRVLSSASIPTLPSSLNSFVFIPPAIVLALIGAGLLAVFLEQLDGSLRTERDISDALGIRCSGSVPLSASSKKSWLRSLSFNFLSSARRKALGQGRSLPAHRSIPQDERYTEGIRSVVASALQLTSPQQSPTTLLVTSSVPGEGKTALAISLAAYVARIQRRVLLIDLSFRSPSVANELGGSPENGILQLLEGRPPAELTRAAEGLGFDYLPLSCGSVDPTTILAVEQMPNLLRQLAARYDCVIIDGAALLSATEPRLLASMVDKVLLVVKWGSTPREVVQNALRLVRCPARHHVTAVISQVDLEKHARYRYGDFSENLFHLKSNPA